GTCANPCQDRLTQKGKRNRAACHPQQPADLPINPTGSKDLIPFHEVRIRFGCLTAPHPGYAARPKPPEVSVVRVVSVSNASHTHTRAHAGPTKTLTDTHTLTGILPPEGLDNTHHTPSGVVFARDSSSFQIVARCSMPPSTTRSCFSPSVKVT